MEEISDLISIKTETYLKKNVNSTYYSHKKDKMKRYVFALDLIDDQALIAEYEHWHKEGNGWPEIKKSIVESGIMDMQIYRTGNRLFMIIETSNDFDLAKKVKMDFENPKVKEWKA